LVQLCRSEIAVFDLGGATLVVRRIQLDVLAGTAVLRVLTRGGLDIESDVFRSSLPLSVLRPRNNFSSSSLLTTTTIPGNSDLAAPRLACTSRPSHEIGTVSLSHSSSSADGTRGFEKVRRNMLCGEVKYGDCASDGGTGMSTGLLEDRRREWLLPTPDFNETGREGGICGTGDGCGVKDIMLASVFIKDDKD